MFNCRTSVRVVVCLLLAPGMVACAQVEDFMARIGLEPPGQAPSATTQEPAPERARRGESEVAKAEVPRRNGLAASGLLTGFTEGEAADLLGNPQAVSENPPAIIWNYASKDCHLSLFFYKDVSTNTFRVLTHKVTPEKTDAKSCVDAIRKKRG